MRAICIREPGGVDVLEMREISEPAPGHDEIRVAVRAFGLNRGDVLQRRGLYPAPPDVSQDIPGLEFAGEVEAIGPHASRFKPGDRVMGIVGGGAYAEKLVIHERAAMRIPERLEWPDAAAIPEAFITAFDALVRQGGLVPGEKLLIHAVPSGVGTAALQIGKLIGAFVIGTSRSRDKLRRCEPMGLDVGIAMETPHFAEDAKHAAGSGLDLILDTVGGGYLEENVAALAPKGRLIVVGLMGGNAGRLPLGLVLTHRLTIRGTVLRSRPLEEKLELSQAFERQMVPLFAQGRLRPVIDEVLPADEIRHAHARMESNATFGKLVLVW